MSIEQVDANQHTPVQVDDWNELVRYTELLSKGSGKDYKICVIDEEKEEIRVQNKEEFDWNVKYAQDHEIKSLTLVIYIGDKRVFNGIYQIKQTTEKPVFPMEKLQILFDNVLADKWYIPVKQDEALGVCLIAAINLAKEHKTEMVDECKRFIEYIVPEAFRKLQNTTSVLSWPREIQCGIFELLELMVDLVGTRLRYPPVPIALLNTLAMTFDTNSSFSQKHKNELLPLRRSYTLKEEDFLSNDFDNETFGWLRSLIQRFIAQNGLINVRLQFEYIDSSNSTTAAMEYNALLKLFAKCKRCINPHRFRTIFIRPIRQVIQYLQKQKSSNEMTDELKELNETLLDICYKYELNDEVAKLTTVLPDPNTFELSSPSIETCSEITPLIDVPNSVQRKTKNPEGYERLTEDIQSMTMNCNDLERKNIKKQRTDEQIPTTPLFTRNHLLDCIDELLTTTTATTDKRPLKRKHRREQQRSTLTTANTGHTNKKETKTSSTTNTTYDRSNPDDILRYFAPMKLKIATLYDNLHAATSNGNLREVLKIEEKLKLLHPFSARFIADENTPDGTIMKPGEVFRKGWTLLNDGSMPWDSNDIQLINLSNGIEVLQQPIVPVTAPHNRAVITVDYKCANQPGTYESKWILAYRQQTFGPMIWCSIEVNSNKTIQTDLVPDFEFVEIPLPACFDLSKPYQSAENSLRSSAIFTRRDSVDSACDTLQCSSISDIDSISTMMSLPPLTLETDEPPREQPVTLIDLTPENSSNDEEQPAIRLNQSLDFVDTVVTNIFSVAKQAGSTAKAIFNTLQAIDEPTTEPKPTLVNTFSPTETTTNGFFDHIEIPAPSANSISSNDPMKTLVEMGFANRAKNQRLLRENANDLAKVIELLTLENNEDVDWFTKRH